MHIHSGLELYGLFLAGQLLYMLKRAGMAVQAKLNAIDSRRSYLRKYWDALLFRAALGVIIFGLLVDNPKWLANYGIGFEFPIDHKIAFGCGLFADVILDWVIAKIPAGIRNAVPFLPGDPPRNAPTLPGPSTELEKKD